jgi:protein-S-isoprenylcysteine O-methyltransferase Ste14
MINKRHGGGRHARRRAKTKENEMNNAQIVNLVVTLIVGATATTVAKVGIDTASWTKDVTDLVMLAIAAGTWFWSHKWHGNPPAAPPQQQQTTTKT